MGNMFRFTGLLFVTLLPGVLAAQQPPALPALKQEAAAQVDGLQTLTQQMVDEIFSFSELGFQEFETSRYVTGILEKNGFQVELGVAGIPTAWVAAYGSGEAVIAFITALDLIPRASEKSLVAYYAPFLAGASRHGASYYSGMLVLTSVA